MMSMVGKMITQQMDIEQYYEAFGIQAKHPSIGGSLGVEHLINDEDRKRMNEANI